MAPKKRGWPKGKPRKAPQLVDISNEIQQTSTIAKEKSIDLETSKRPDLCFIIESASRSNVSKLKLKDQNSEYEIEFFSKGPLVEQESAENLVTKAPILQSSEVPKSLSRDATVGLKEIMEDFHRNDMMISNPLAFEQQMIDSYKESEQG